MDAFERFVTSGLELRGIAVDDTDLLVMRGADAVYGAAIRALLDADMAGATHEVGLDPGRPPRMPDER